MILPLMHTKETLSIKKPLLKSKGNGAQIYRQSYCIVPGELFNLLSNIFYLCLKKTVSLKVGFDL